jgi:hypothetical protein
MVLFLEPTILRKGALMSASIKFYLLDEVELGSLPKAQLIKWRELVKERETLENLEKDYKERLKAFFEEAEKVLPLREDHSREEPAISIDKSGNAYQAFCRCPICQADAQGLTLASVLEALRMDKAISMEDELQIRKQAAERKAEKERNSRRRLLLN